MKNTFIYFYWMYLRILCIYLGTLCVCSTFGSPKRVLKPPELDLQTLGTSMWVLVTKTRAANALTSLSISATPV